MLNLLQKVNKIISYLPIFIMCIVAGIVSATVVKCTSKPVEPAPVRIELYNYEKRIEEIRDKRDSTYRSIPTHDNASRYLYDRYDREANANKRR